jgi:hypothetical protein
LGRHPLAQALAARKNAKPAIEKFIGQGFDDELKNGGFAKNLSTAT